MGPATKETISTVKEKNPWIVAPRSMIPIDAQVIGSYPLLSEPSIR